MQVCTSPHLSPAYLQLHALRAFLSEILQAWKGAAGSPAVNYGLFSIVKFSLHEMKLCAIIYNTKEKGSFKRYSLH